MLPHNVYLTTFRADEVIRKLKKEPNTEVDLAASVSFYDVSDDFDWDGVLRAYDSFFEERVREFEALLGPPAFRGEWDSPELEEWRAIIPEFADAQKLVVWKGEGSSFYLRYSREDKEVPVLISAGIEGCSETGIAYPGQFE